MLTGEPAATNQQMVAFRQGEMRQCEMRQCLRRGRSLERTAFPFKLLNLDLGETLFS